MMMIVYRSVKFITITTITINLCPIIGGSYLSLHLYFHSLTNNEVLLGDGKSGGGFIDRPIGLYQGIQSI